MHGHSFLECYMSINCVNFLMVAPSRSQDLTLLGFFMELGTLTNSELRPLMLCELLNFRDARSSVHVEVRNFDLRCTWKFGWSMLDAL